MRSSRPRMRVKGRSPSRKSGRHAGRAAKRAELTIESVAATGKAGKMKQQVTVVGGGTMGTGIAYVSAFAGHAVTVVEPDEGKAAAMTHALAEATSGAVK